MWNEVSASEVEALLGELRDIVSDPVVMSVTKSGEDKQPISEEKTKPKAVGRVGFSTYAGVTESRRTVVPLYERLPPITPPVVCSIRDELTMSGADTLRKGFLLLPNLTGDDEGMPQRPMSPNEVRRLLCCAESSARGGAANNSATSPTVGEGGDVKDSYREPNFLPIMCARHICPGGIVPRARWGHTLTAVQGHKLVLFGGMDLKEGDTSDLFEYDAHHVVWDPVLVADGVGPTPRTNHAACAAEDRWLYVSGGTTARGTIILGDIYRFDTWTHEWKCLWEYKGIGTSASNSTSKNEPTPRFGHSMLHRDGRLYIFGGRALKRNHSGSRGDAVTCMASADVYVFSLTSGKWKKRIQAGKENTVSDEAKAPGSAGPCASERQENESAVELPPTRPTVRFHHAACIMDSTMFINGGIDGDSVTLADTWALNLKEGRWIRLHDGSTADAHPREKHHLFACGSCLLAVGGCSASDRRSLVSRRCRNFVAALALESENKLGSVSWFPLAMGNAAAVVPNRKSFGAAFSGGFVHVFGGICGCEPPSNTMVRFLAADGYFATDSTMVPSSSAGNKEGAISMMRSVRESGDFVTYDAYILPRSWDGDVEVDTVANRPFGVHRALVQQRAPKFWEDVLRCRTSVAKSIISPTADASSQLVNFACNPGLAESGTADNPTVGSCNRAGCDEEPNQAHVTAYYTEGNSRVQGLSVSLTANQLQCLLDYIYWGDMRLSMLTELDDDNVSNRGREDLQKTAAQEEVRTVQSLMRAAEVYELPLLHALCNALSSGNIKELREARKRCGEQLQEDLLHLLKTSRGATATVLFVDPHTKQQVSCSLHPFILTASNSFFKDLLRPLLTGEKMAFQMGSVSAKLCAAGRYAASKSRRGIVVGPVPMPYLAVQPVLCFLYTRQLQIPRESVFATMLGSRLLDVAPLQAYCETILAREEVNYDTALHFFSLAGRYQAPLLQEIALLTAVMGYGVIRPTMRTVDLSEEEVKEIAAVAEELGTDTWVPPPQTSTVAKTREEYQARWDASLA
ncbi:hypothetical protein, conserved [Trypanosoma brucei gambiense DAL972]|uniref:BTB domain-containing protein n=1 Tax=Trypanosoma brucei gambiense (strain MHOM/CI/86/DAL972) TaxID=679716 RepID=C9ZSL3_TRYB9|nr:hypothetical protein, conserved [Trypanosoma brucei gambiense DAL972]CBH12397.1 hypothetical protein, conserved [Trypanosoma brucei gambiense DAL972]|eukprot:XP_011774678.1 hypothetical protein, conserved [Trypanosoma brucei gambiense DAL972]